MQDVGKSKKEIIVITILWSLQDRWYLCQSHRSNYHFQLRDKLWPRFVSTNSIKNTIPTNINCTVQPASYLHPFRRKISCEFLYLRFHNVYIRIHFKALKKDLSHWITFVLYCKWVFQRKANGIGKKHWVHWPKYNELVASKIFELCSSL